IEPESQKQQQNVETEETKHGPGTDHQKQHARHETYATEQQHQNQKSGAAERPVRRQCCRKDRGLKFAAVVGDHHAHYTGIMAKKPVGKAPAKARNRKARKPKHARLKPVSKQVAADAKAAAGVLPQWSTAQIEEAFRRFKNA